MAATRVRGLFQQFAADYMRPRLEVITDRREPANVADVCQLCLHCEITERHSRVTVLPVTRDFHRPITVGI